MAQAHSQNSLYLERNDNTQLKRKPNFCKRKGECQVRGNARYGNHKGC